MKKMKASLLSRLLCAQGSLVSGPGLAWNQMVRLTWIGGMAGRSQEGKCSFRAKALPGRAGPN